MMRFGFDHIQLIEDEAKSGKTIEQIASAVNVSFEDFKAEIQVQSSPAAIAFYRGRSKAAEIIKNGIKKNAPGDSNLNQTLDLFVEQERSLEL